MDPTAGRLAVVVTCVLPFMDRDVLHLFDALERAVYDKPAADKIGESAGLNAPTKATNEVQNRS